MGPFCFTSTEARWLIRDGVGWGAGGLGGWGEGGGPGGGGRGGRLDRGYRPKKTGETVDLRQTNGSVKAVSPRHCPATSALRSYCFNCVLGQSHKDNVRCTAVEEQLEAKEVQLISSRLTLRVQLHPPSFRSLDLSISPGTLCLNSFKTDTLTPLTGPACETSELKGARIRPQKVYFPVL